MAESLHRLRPLRFFDWGRCLKRTLGFLGAAFILHAWSALGRPQASVEIQDITGKYQFISADDTLGILEEEGKLKGYVEIYQGEDESDTVLSYSIIRGLRKKDHVEFRTNQIHRKYYRFSGKVERGRGHEEGDPDYLRLVGDVEIVTVKGDSGEEAVQGTHMVLKSLGKNEREEE
jgi:hypothetical protein